MRLGNSALESNDDHLSSDPKPCPVTHQLRLRHAFSEINVHRRKTDISKEKGSILPVCVGWEPPVNDTASSSASERIIIRVTVSSRGGLSQSRVVSTLNLLRAAFCVPGKRNRCHCGSLGHYKRGQPSGAENY